MTERHRLSKTHFTLILAAICVVIFVFSMITAGATSRRQQATDNKWYRYGKVGLKVTKSGNSWLSNVVSLSRSEAPSWSSANTNGASWNVSQTNSTSLAMSSSSAWATSKSYSVASNRIPHSGQSNTASQHVYMAPRQFNFTMPKGYKYDSVSADTDDRWSWLAWASVPDAIASASGSDRSSNIILHISSVFPGIRTMADSSQTPYRYVLSDPDNNNGNNVTAYNSIILNIVPQSYSISYDLKGGRQTNPKTSYNVETATFSLVNPARTGYTFSGWTGSNGSTAQTNVSIAKGSTGNKSYTANWAGKTAVIEFDANGGDGYMEDQDHIYGTTQRLDKCGFENEGCRFTGWNTERDGGGDRFADEADIRTSFPEGGRITLYAQWESKDAVIRFDGNGNTGGSMDDQAFSLDERTTLHLNKYTKTSSVFAGWNTAPDGSGTSFGDGEEILISEKENSELTLYAQWTEGRFSLEGDTRAEGCRFEWMSPENGTLRVPVTLSDGKKYTIFGIDNNAVYRITEDGSNDHIPSYIVSEGYGPLDKEERVKEGDKGKSLSTPEGSRLTENTTYDFTNKHSPGGGSLTVKKKVTGDLADASDRAAVFRFSYTITGLDPGREYPLLTHISGQEPEEDSETVLTAQTALSAGEPGYGKSGVITGEIGLKHGDYFTIGEITEGAKYNITEKTDVGAGADAGAAGSVNWPYRSSYEVTEGGYDDEGNPVLESMTSARDDALPGGGNTLYGLSINQEGEHNEQGLGTETMPGHSVEYLFRNAKADDHDITIRKKIITDDEEDAETDEEFAVDINFSNLAPDTLYTSQDASCSFRTDANGKADVAVRIKGREQITFRDIPGDAEYEMKEAGSGYTADVKVIEGEDTIRETSGMYGQGVSISNQDSRIMDDSDEEIGLSADQTILFTNTKKTKNDIIINKETAGQGAKHTDEFEYTVRFAGITVDDYEVIKQTKNDDGEVTDTIFSAYRPSSAEDTYTFTLKSDQTIILKGIPDSATYEITEAASEGYTPSYTYAKGDTDSPSGSAGENTSLSTGAQELPADAEITFTNIKNAPKPEKTVSDSDDKTWGGSGQEIDVKENTVPGRNAEWDYKITQRVYPGYGSFVFEDVLPENVKLRSAEGRAGDISIRWTKEDGTVTDEDIAAAGGEDEDDEEFTSQHFRVMLSDSSVNVSSSDPEYISEGGTFEIVIRVKVDPDAGDEDFRKAGQMYKVNERIVFKNRATVTLDENEYRSNLVRTNIPLGLMLGIKKNVTGNLGDMMKEFEFTLALSGLKPEKRYTYDNAAYVQVSAEYGNDGRLYIQAKTEKGDPVRGVDIRIYSDESNIQRKTGSDGRTSFSLEQGDHKYEYTYDGESVCGSFTTVAGSDGENYSADEIEEVFLPRNDYETEKCFLTDESGNAKIRFKLRDDESISFADLPEGLRYKITEAASNHIPSYKVARGPDDLERRSDELTGKGVILSTPDESLTGSTEYIFTNHRELEPVTAVKEALLPALLLAVAVLIVSLMLRKTTRSKQRLS